MAQAVLGPALPIPPALAVALRAADRLGAEPGDTAIRSFFELRFQPIRLTASEAFFTGYYEPVLEASLTRTDRFTAPLLARPDDLVTLASQDARPAWARDLSALRRGPDGMLSPYPDRAAIEAAIQNGDYRPVVWLRDAVEAFTVQVQGSARVTLPGGERLRLTYAGRNGLPYTSLGRVLAEAGVMPAAELTMDRLKAWLRDKGTGPGQPGHALLMRNQSYIFFSAELDAGPEAGPIGGAGVPLVAGRSIAVDRTRWSYGLPFWVDVVLPDMETRLRRLCVAEDTGSAIVGDTRVDLFLGSGEAAGRVAGAIRQRGGLTVLWPRELER